MTHDYTDCGVISYTEQVHDVTGIVRLAITPTPRGAAYVASVLERIEQMHSELEPLDWWQAIPILRRQEPSSIVCSTFILEALQIPTIESYYRSPVALYESLKEMYPELVKLPEVTEVLYYGDNE